MYSTRLPASGICISRCAKRELVQEQPVERTHQGRDVKGRDYRNEKEEPGQIAGVSCGVSMSISAQGAAGTGNKHPEPQQRRQSQIAPPEKRCGYHRHTDQSVTEQYGCLPLPPKATA